MLTVVDVAGNQELARRFVLYDNHTSRISVNEEYPIRVASATVSAGSQWITEVFGIRTSVNLTWKGHFENKFHHRRGYLNAIGDHRSGFVDNGERFIVLSCYSNQ